MCAVIIKLLSTCLPTLLLLQLLLQHLTGTYPLTTHTFRTTLTFLTLVMSAPHTTRSQTPNTHHTHTTHTPHTHHTHTHTTQHTTHTHTPTTHTHTHTHTPHTHTHT